MIQRTTTLTNTADHESVEPARTVQEWPVSGTGRAPRPHPQGRTRGRHPSPGDTDAGGQDAPACGVHAPGPIYEHDFLSACPEKVSKEKAPYGGAPARLEAGRSPGGWRRARGEQRPKCQWHFAALGAPDRDVRTGVRL